MAKVNLMKAEIGGISTSFVSNISLGRVPKALLMLSIFCFLAAVLILAHTLFLKSNLKNVSSEYTDTEKLKKEIGLLDQKRNQVQKDITLLRAFLDRDVIWSSKLEQLRRIIPDEVWLRQLFFGKKGGDEGVPSLFLSGALVPRQDMNAIATLSNFINQLKKNEEFLKGFGNPILSDVRTESRQDSEIMIFSIEMPIEKGR
jgi:hypothetical protein